MFQPEAAKRTQGLLLRALVDVPRLGEADWRQASWLVRWLIASRAAVLPLTAFAVLFAFAIAPSVDVLVASLTLLGLLLAHATNNLINDHVDARMGLDAGNYFRTRYGTQPLAAGWVSASQHRRLILVTGLLASVCGVVVFVISDGDLFMPLLAGAVFVLFYTWPMKHVGFGEIAVWIVWGPLMVGSTVLAVSGCVELKHWLLGGLYGLGPLVVILGKHTDKRDDDLQRGVRTLPTLMPERWARQLLRLTALALVAGATTWAVVSGQWAYLLLLVAWSPLLEVWRLTAEPRPLQAPQSYEPWPLWFAAVGFVFARRAGALMLIAALLDRIWRIAAG